MTKKELNKKVRNLSISTIPRIIESRIFLERIISDLDLAITYLSNSSNTSNLIDKFEEVIEDIQPIIYELKEIQEKYQS